MFTKLKTWPRVDKLVLAILMLSFLQTFSIFFLGMFMYKTTDIRLQSNTTVQEDSLARLKAFDVLTYSNECVEPDTLFSEFDTFVQSTDTITIIAIRDSMYYYLIKPYKQDIFVSSLDICSFDDSYAQHSNKFNNAGVQNESDSLR